MKDYNLPRNDLLIIKTKKEVSFSRRKQVGLRENLMRTKQMAGDSKRRNRNSARTSQDLRLL